MTVKYISWRFQQTGLAGCRLRYTLKGAAIGGVSAGAIYTLTNHASLGAPFASALVTAAKGVSNLALSHQRGEINADEFTDLGLIICAESAIVGAMSVAGQAIIPVPCFGALVGSYLREVYGLP